MSVDPNFSPHQIITEALRTEQLIRALIKEIRTSIPVEVMAVHYGAGSPPAIGTVDVQPLVQTVGNGRLWEVGVTYGAQFSRDQAGGNGIVMDPEVGDIGLATACDRDISSVVAAAGLAGPGSNRTHDLADLVYVRTIISSASLAQYIWFAGGINIQSPAVTTSGNLSVGTGATGSFTDLTGLVVTVQNGIITNIE
jgi:hypothetical protein